MSTTETSPASKPFLCDQCSRSFNRLEHLSRHRHTHDTPSASKHFCPTCGKSFIRKDVLLRHVRAIHDQDGLRKTSRRRSCLRCVRYKVKCSGGPTCEACAKRNLVCDYGTDKHNNPIPIPQYRSSAKASPSEPSRPADTQTPGHLASPLEQSQQPPQQQQLGQQYHPSSQQPQSQSTSYQISNSPSTDYSANAKISDDFTQATAILSSLDGSNLDFLKMSDDWARDSAMLDIDWLRPDFFPDSQTSPFPEISSIPVDPNPPKNASATAISIPDIDPNAILYPLFPQNTLDFDTFYSQGRPSTSGASAYSNFAALPHTQRASQYPDKSLQYQPGNPIPLSPMGFSGTSAPLKPGTSLPPVILESHQSSDYDSVAASIPTPQDHGHPSPSVSEQHTSPQSRETAFLDSKWKQGSKSQISRDFALPPPKPRWKSNADIFVNAAKEQPFNYRQNIDSLASNSRFQSMRDSNPLLNPSLVKPSNVRSHGQSSRSQTKGDNWPLAPGAENIAEQSEEVRLPPIRQVVGDYGITKTDRGPLDLGNQKMSITNEVREDLVKLLSVHFEYHPFQKVDIDKFPETSIVNQFLALYFQNFHPILPVIHRPTFSAQETPTILLGTMLSIGASYSRLEGAVQFAEALSELCKRTIIWLAHYDTAYLRSAYVIASMCLQSVFALGSGNPRLYERAESDRSFLVSNARRMGLFSVSKSDPWQWSGPQTLNNPAELERVWNLWKEEEMHTRLAWGVFETDGFISIPSSHRGAVTLNDLGVFLPCAEELWEAETPQEWVRLFDPNKGPPRGLHSYNTIREVISCAEKLREHKYDQQSRDWVEALPVWGKRLSIQIVARIIWDMRELEYSGLSIIMPQMRLIFAPPMERLLRSIDILLDATIPSRKPGVLDGVAAVQRVHTILASHIGHFVYLYAAREVLDLLLILVRYGQNERDRAADGLKRILQSQPVVARELAWHCAQIIGISSNFFLCAPSEIMRVFMATMYLYVFSMLSLPPDPSNPMELKEVTVLDKVGHGVQAWRERGGPVALSKVPDLYSASAPGQVLEVGLLTLRNLQNWGLTQKFVNAIRFIYNRDINNSCSRGSETSSNA
ncbi:hypothetical protein CANCADRAFT_3561 [Tortispora caseinolytica NRRL Y-17796]|uniref:C2H2-type domain-containing protein n=1 Tax=Tortispora caseinolytica NRRL Y-17796 TaxID=767744 RepID=A0A1E4TBA2_9ASCO|nr:hypothetical protein CANCADRAFT_3561 [Tortispora caseinolytica NRRL Y-17796]